MLDSTVAEVLRNEYVKLDRQGKLLPQGKLDDCYRTFRQRFGPQALSTIDGESLLEKMHGHGKGDTLVYWLEFKDDEEFPARFGSISGGSALKFGIYRRKETGEWMTGSSKDQRKITVPEAVHIARKHREQLIDGCKVLEGYANGDSAVNYEQLQISLTQAAPDVADSAWGHKYFSLMFPQLLDDFHNPDYQRYHLIKSLVEPPQAQGRYVCAGLFVRMCREFGWPMNHLTSTINSRNGSPHAYWRIGTRHGDSGQTEWDVMKANSCVSIGWSDLGDLSHLTYDRASKEQLRELHNQHYSGDPRAVGRAVQQIFNFVIVFSDGDIVLASDGASVLGIGRIAGDYQYDPSLSFPHTRSVEWLSLKPWKMTQPEGLRTTVFRLGKYPTNLIACERHCLTAEPTEATAQNTKAPLSPLTGTFARVQSILERKGQVILYGPPGTGKTFCGEQVVGELAARSNFGCAAEALTVDQKLRLDPAQSESFVRICCFHPSYGYEDFVEGYRPKKSDGQLTFELRDGIFKSLCDSAAKQPEKKFYLLIDEINRGDIPRIFGELIMLLERNKRGKTVQLPVSGHPFAVPHNLAIVGTMNTADRSIALLDTALRRRFGFIEMMPDYTLLSGAVIQGVPVGQWLESLNQRICKSVGRDARNLQIGHSYFMERGKAIQTIEQFQRTIRDDIFPLLQEYCYEDFSLLEKLLGPVFVNTRDMTFNVSICSPEKYDEFVDALLKIDPSISTSADAVEAENNVPEDDVDSEESNA